MPSSLSSPPDVIPHAFSRPFTTTAVDRSSVWRFEASSYKATSEGLPPSRVQPDAVASVFMTQPTTPPKCPPASVRLPSNMLPSPGTKGLGLRSYFLTRPLVGSLALRPGDSLTIQRMAWSVGFLRFVSSAEATHATGVLTVPPVGLTPTEQVSLRWTRWSANILRTRHAANSSRPYSWWSPPRIDRATIRMSRGNSCPKMGAAGSPSEGCGRPGPRRA